MRKNNGGPMIWKAHPQTDNAIERLRRVDCSMPILAALSHVSTEKDYEQGRL
jgi:hypothetical protein